MRRGRHIGKRYGYDPELWHHQTLPPNPDGGWWNGELQHYTDDIKNSYVDNGSLKIVSIKENHVVNGCCWLNHSSKNTGVFIDIVRNNPCIKAWFSGHFHLGQDYQDSITFPDGQNRGSCVFCQTAVMAAKSSRDTRQQSRVLRGNADGFTIGTINHSKDGEERLDATITYTDESHESIEYYR